MKYDFPNHLKLIRVELRTAQHEGAVGFDGRG